MIDSSKIKLIEKHCDEFLNETHHPLVKNFNKLDHFVKIKVRHKSLDHIGKIFNTAFPHYNMLYERSLRVNGDEPNPNFYVFPVNGYKFVYSKEVVNFSQEYKKILSTISDASVSKDTDQIVSDLIRFSYTNIDLNDAICSKCEILLYNIPFFYAINSSCVSSYDELLHILRR